MSEMCFSKASLLGGRPCLLVERKAAVHAKNRYVDVVYRMEELTLFRLFLSLLGRRAGENGSILRTQLAGIMHWLVPQSEVAVCLD